MNLNFVRSLAGAACGAAAIAAMTTTLSAQNLPIWKPNQICANDSAQGQCLLFERRARADVAASWTVLPVGVRQSCLTRFAPPLEPSWRILGDCIEIEARRAQDAVFDAQAKKEVAQLAVLVSDRKAATEDKQRGAAQQQRMAQAKPAQGANGSASAAANGDDEARRIAEEEASFMATLAAQRRADAEEAKRKAEAKKAADEAKRKIAELAAAEEKKRKEALAAAEARSAEAEQKRLADEEASFMESLAAQRRADAEEAKRKAAAKEAAKAKAAEDEKRRVAEEEASFMATLAAQRRADAEEAKRKAEAKKEADAKAAAARKSAAQSCEARLKEVKSDGVIQFASGSTELRNGPGKAVLDKLAAAVGKCEGQLTIEVEGHTDSTGSDSSNMSLSKGRAEAVARYLSSKGVAANRISARGFGETKPIASNTTVAGRAKNRRIEFKVK